MIPSWSGIARTVGRVVRFGAAPAFAVLSTVLVLPLVSRIFGGPGILAVTIGQATGAVASIVVSLGWPLLGPALIARGASTTERARIYLRSLTSRGLILIGVTPLIVVFSVLAVDEQRTTAALAAVAFALNGFTAVWYFVGTGEPSGLLRYEAAPRLVATAIAAAALLGGAPLWAYPLTLIGGAVVSAWLVLRSVGGHRERVSWSDTLSEVRSQFASTVARSLNSLYFLGAAPMVSVLAPASALWFAAFDRVGKSAFNASEAVLGAFTSTVSASFPPSRRAQRTVLLVDAGLAVLVGVGLYVVFPHVNAYLFGDLFPHDDDLRAATAAALSLATLSRGALMHGVLPWGDRTFTWRSLSLVSMGGVGTIMGAAAVSGAIGAMYALAAIELTLAALLLGRVAQLRRRHLRENPDAAIPIETRTPGA